MEGKVYGYARVSSKDQNLDRQLDALEMFGVPKEAVFSDKASGKDFERPGYRRLVGMLAEGDVLVVKSIDRLGRNYEEILRNGATSPKIARPPSWCWICRYSIHERRKTASQACSSPISCCSCSPT